MYKIITLRKGQGLHYKFITLMKGQRLQYKFITLMKGQGLQLIMIHRWEMSGLILWWSKLKWIINLVNHSKCRKIHWLIFELVLCMPISPLASSIISYINPSYFFESNVLVLVFHKSMQTKMRCTLYVFWFWHMDLFRQNY